MTTQKTQEELQEIGRAIGARTGEWLDGFVIVGFVAGSDPPQPLIIYPPNHPDFKTQCAINALLVSAVRPVGIQNMS